MQLFVKLTTELTTGWSLGALFDKFYYKHNYATSINQLTSQKMPYSAPAQI